MRRIGVAHPVEKGVGVQWCDMSFYFFGGPSIKVSGIDVGFVGRVVRMGSEGVKELLEFTFVRKDVDASQMDYVVVEWRRQGPCNRLVEGG